ncbi:sulfate transporter [Halobellus sp. Atlit-38R]|uniref:putative sulfate/molybdate transporter n=1 Tax=Halobellus sp. Atlit-38R TaxID=2282131 RepID=UPI000EF17E05|nr:putative sulfate/molybdate transporter [Halobellus sp. Atlit-38R]RLM88071.1 sulfate transporter [Halobellus sp. Atlit-38R]
MDVFARGQYSNRLDFSRHELTGALGDSVTVLPVVVAAAALTDLSLSRLLLGFAVFQVVWGLHYGLPISVEPMKALAALVIAGSLTTSELAVAGLLAGGILLAVGATGTLARIERYVGQPVIRGVQLAVGLVLLETGVRLSLDGVWYALLALAVVGISVAIGQRRASTLAVLAVGIGIGLGQTGLPVPHLPTAALALPSASGLSSDSIGATVAQLAMTVGNAAVATSLLLSDYYDADVSADDLASSMGAMNLLAVPLGAMPMCHGSGGVAGKYAFGARTAGANLILGVLYALAAVVAVGAVAAFPLAMLGVVLAVIAVELGRAGLETDSLSLTVGIGVLGVVTNVGVAFVVGVAAYLLRKRFRDDD